MSETVSHRELLKLDVAHAGELMHNFPELCSLRDQSSTPGLPRVAEEELENFLARLAVLESQTQ